jgi:hypothetical protein
MACGVERIAYGERRDIRLGLFLNIEYGKIEVIRHDESGIRTSKIFGSLGLAVVQGRYGGCGRASLAHNPHIYPSTTVIPVDPDILL